MGIHQIVQCVSHGFVEFCYTIFTIGSLVRAVVCNRFYVTRGISVRVDVQVYWIFYECNTIYRCI